MDHLLWLKPLVTPVSCGFRPRPTDQLTTNAVGPRHCWCVQGFMTKCFNLHCCCNKWLQANKSLTSYFSFQRKHEMLSLSNFWPQDCIARSTFNHNWGMLGISLSLICFDFPVIDYDFLVINRGKECHKAQREEAGLLIGTLKGVVNIGSPAVSK